MELPTMEEVVKRLQDYDLYIQGLRDLIHKAKTKINDDYVEYYNEFNIRRFERMKNIDEWYEYNNDSCNSPYCNNELPNKYYRLKGTGIVFCNSCIESLSEGLIDKNKDSCIELIERDRKDNEYFERLSNIY
jgi:hypothetical protein